MTKMKLFMSLLATALSLSTTIAGAVPSPRGVSFICGEGVVIDCAIPRVQNPELSTRCWYIAGGQRFLMRTEGPYRFRAGPIHVRLIDGLPMSARMVNLESGARAFCAQE